MSTVFKCLCILLAFLFLKACISGFDYWPSNCSQLLWRGVHSLTENFICSKWPSNQSVVKHGTSLWVRWLRICLPMQKTRVQSLIGKPRFHVTGQLLSPYSSTLELQLWSPHALTTKACALQQEKLHWNEKPTHHSPYAAVKTQHNKKLKKKC